MFHYAYHYEALKSPDEFRVVVIQPGEESDPVRCQIRNVLRTSDGNVMKYEAISYVWGSPGDKTQIDCESGFVEAPSNLHSALRHLRWPDRPLVVWADSLAINQGNEEEKTTQVQSMDKVFSSAEQVLMWLGEETEGTSDALPSLSLLCDFVGNPEDSPEWERLLKHIDRAKSIPHPHTRARELMEIKSPNYASIATVLSRPYFCRRWIVQEIILANKATLIYGRQTLDWSVVGRRSRELMRWSQLGSHILFRVVERGVNIQGFEDFFTIAASNKASETDNQPIKSLYDALTVCTDFQCADRRDMLFALIHIGGDWSLENDSELAPNYSMSESEMLHRLAA